MIVQRPAKTMLAAVLYGSEDLRMERIPLPTPGEGELLVRVAAALTCGTDLKVYRRGYHALMLTPPDVFGHELAGAVAEVGPGPVKFAVGDCVVPMNSAPCDACFYCLHGQQNLCEDLLFNNGAYAEYLLIPARIVEKNTLLVPERVPLEFAALTEPLACVVHGFNEMQPPARRHHRRHRRWAHRTDVHAGCAIARAAGDRRRQARRPGCRGAPLRRIQVVQIAPGVDTVAAVRKLTGDSRGADVVIEAVATPETWEWAVAMVRKGGVVNFFGGPPSGTVVGLDTNRLHYGDITLKASFHHTPAACADAFALICSGEFKCDDFITRTAGLDEVPAVFARMVTRSLDNIADIKTAVFPNGYRPKRSRP